MLHFLPFRKKKCLWFVMLDDLLLWRLQDFFTLDFGECEIFAQTPELAVGLPHSREIHSNVIGGRFVQKCVVRSPIFTSPK